MKFFPFKTKRDNCTAYVVEKTYSSPSNLCLEIHNFNSMTPLCIATTNIAGYHCDPGNVLIKNWNENQGVYEALLAAGVIGPVIRKVPAGYVEAYECKYLKGE
jgi:hypothetical protein